MCGMLFSDQLSVVPKTRGRGWRWLLRVFEFVFPKIHKNWSLFFEIKNLEHFRNWSRWNIRQLPETPNV